MQTYTHANVHTYTHTSTHIHTHAHTCTHIHTHTHTYTHMHTHAHTYTHIHTHMHTCTHIHTHTHTCTYAHTLEFLSGQMSCEVIHSVLHVIATSQCKHTCTCTCNYTIPAFPLHGMVDDIIPTPSSSLVHSYSCIPKLTSLIHICGSLEVCSSLFQ